MRAHSPWPLWPLHLIWGICLVLVMGAGALWSLHAQLDAALTLPARFAPTAPERLIQHPQGGRIAALYVSEGEHVIAGQALLRLADDAIAAESALITIEENAIALRRLRLLAEAAGKLPDFGPLPPVDPAIGEELALYQARSDDHRLQAARLAQDQTRLSARITALTHQAAAVAQQIDLRREELATQTALATAGLAQRTAQRHAAAALAALEAEAAALDAALIEARAEHATIPLEAARLEARRRHDITAELQTLATRAQALAARATYLATAQDGLVLHAPVSGIIQNLRADAMTLGAGEAALHIVPEGRLRIVHADLPAARIADISQGQRARLRFASAPLRNAQPLQGHVSAIAPQPHRDPFSGAQLLRIEVTLDAIPPNIRAGQEADLQLLTGAATPIAYLLAPLTQYFATAFGES